MGSLKHFIHAFLGGFALIHLVDAQDQSGFISIACGSPANSNYSEPTTGINYISDVAFRDTGISQQISNVYKGGFQQQVWNLRSFPQGIRNCYNIGITQGTKYLIRGTFLYGNYDGQSKLPQFDIHLGVNMWDTVNITNVTIPVFKELIHVPSQTNLQVCLVNTGLGMPFISAIELRPLSNKTYVTNYGSLALFVRLDVGSISRISYRYPFDIYDRIWDPYNDNTYTILSTSQTIDTPSNNYYQPPSIVMSTASTPINVSAPLELFWYTENATYSEYYIYMHFAEVVNLTATQFRSFNITLNGKYWYGPIAPKYLSTITLFSPSILPNAQKYDFSFFKAEGSTLPPIINALEIYSVRDLSQSGTYQKDVDAITNIKSAYGVQKNWEGDPCLPQAYSWAGLNCSYDSVNPPRITSLNLSSSGLTGVISVYISNLTMLQILDLSNNNLTGSVPDFLSQLQYLRVLNLEKNQLTGTIPANLIERSKNGSLLLSVDENLNVCGSGSCKKKNNIAVPIGASVGVLLILALIVASVLWRLKRKQKDESRGLEIAKTEPNIQTMSFRSLESLQRQFTYADLIRITNNFERVLGKGGFGKVYHGYIDDTEVAVKVLSLSSVQGYQQFQAEVKLLMRVHHRNLTTLVGYCYEGPNMGLVYEYMANGDLDAHLSGKNTNILSWEARLNIATDAAQGLEYLHYGCKPPIIHRDVKTTNILLNENFHAKIADFGLSKMFPTDGITHVSTFSVGGTPGYLDPEFSISYRLTEKSDVYSFGVVLLEIITSRPVIERSDENIHISQWVRIMLDKGDIQNIVDPRMYGDFNVNSAWKAIEIAMACVSSTSTERPSMSEVVMKLKECLKSELAQRAGESNYLVEMVNMNMITELIPLAR
ncbi:LRR receptor-like serine/threonine-protein kinase IOS1 [Quercus lobata]|uniref:non-specific serine/threonine protein kinase n=1 Tax=Quercus lobata TaxID=97700 RepID=A0A7N2LKZ8_QUELO|nr:LRR receptor-like serine/threonine-protein kinase IOS1 [Quercus lobata]